MNVEIESQLSGRKIELKVKVTGVPEWLGVKTRTSQEIMFYFRDTMEQVIPL